MGNNFDKNALIDALGRNIAARKDMRRALLSREDPASLQHSFREVAINTPQRRDLVRSANMSQLHGLTLYDIRTPGGLSSWLTHGCNDLLAKTDQTTSFRIDLLAEGDDTCVAAPVQREGLLDGLAYAAVHQQNMFHNLRCIFGPTATQERAIIDTTEAGPAADVITSTRQIMTIMGEDYDTRMAKADLALARKSVIGYEYFTMLSPVFWPKGARMKKFDMAA